MKNKIRVQLNALIKKLKQAQRLYQGLPKGTLVKKIIKGGAYYYLVKREGRSVRYRYIGKVSEKMIAENRKSKDKRKELRQNIADLKRRIISKKRLLKALNIVEEESGPAQTAIPKILRLNAHFL